MAGQPHPRYHAQILHQGQHRNGNLNNAQLQAHLRRRHFKNTERCSYAGQSIFNHISQAGSSQEWRKWSGIKLRISGIPPARRTIRDVYNLVAWSDPMVYRIEIPSNSSYVYIDIRPPPQHDFWNQPNFGNAYGSRARSLNVDVLQLFDPAISSAVRCDQIFMKRMSLDVSSVEIGFLLTPNCMMAMARSAASQSDSERRIVFSVNLERTELELQFPFEIITMSQIQVSRTETLRFQTPFTNIGSIREIELTPTKRILILQLQSPPTWYKKMRDIRASMETDLRDNTWNAYMAWERQTDVVDNISRFRTKPIQLHKPDSLLDLGRWLTFHVAFELNASNQVKYEKLCEALQDWNLKFEKIEFSQFKTVPKALCHIWDVMDGSLQSNSTQTSVGDLLQISRDMKHLTFKVRYQLEVCVSKGCLNEYNLTDEFLRRLGEINPDQACASLERIADRKLRLYNPMDIFPMQDRQSLLPKSLPGYCILSRSCNITPTSILWNTPVVETSNRVIRQYYQYQDRFLRVRFTDEIPLGRVYSRRDQRVEELFARITQVMNHGIILGDRHYEFLAFGNSQFREHGAYFFASLPNLKAEQIRSQLGNLKDIRTAAKWCARLGQNFSTTRAIRTTVMINDSLYDVERNGFNFTDGVGKISKFLAQMIADELRLPNPLEDHPSLFQFRLGGCKGVLAVAPEIPGQEIHIRPSQYKFPAKHHGLEIVRTSQFVTSTLNRQIIVILSALGVKDEVFLSMMQKMIDELEQSMSDKAIAMRLLQKNIDINQCTLVLASMILNGFMDVREPFMISMLRLWKSWNLKYLKEKAKIYVSNGAHLMGCVDEYGVLKGHFNNAHVPEDNLPEIFVKIDPERNGIYQVLEGMCLLARSPSLHPGDVRVVRAVNKPELQHLKNVVVFPQNGDRDIPGMCSGGDVDGDDYLIIWDQALLPREWNLAPMDFTPEKPAPLEREVVVRDVTNFFVQYIKNDNLPVIASAHLCWADHEQAGVKSQKCLRLATLHSNAVDYPKIGIPAIMDKDLHPRKWPHFMERKGKEPYHSTKILGQLYDMVEREDFSPELATSFDHRILNAYELENDMLEKARQLKREYDAAVKRIMAHYAIQTEFEVWSAFVMSHNMEKKDYNFAAELGLLLITINDKFRELCIEAAGGREFEKLGPFIASMYTVTHEEFKDAMPNSVDSEVSSSCNSHSHTGKIPLISFPWIFHHELGRIATGLPHNRLTDIRRKQKCGLSTTVPTSTDLLDSKILRSKGPLLIGEVLTLFDDDEDTTTKGLGPTELGCDNLSRIENCSVHNQDTTSVSYSTLHPTTSSTELSILAEEDITSWSTDEKRSEDSRSQTDISRFEDGPISYTALRSNKIASNHISLIELEPTSSEIATQPNEHDEHSSTPLGYHGLTTLTNSGSSVAINEIISPEAAKRETILLTDERVSLFERLQNLMNKE